MASVSSSSATRLRAFPSCCAPGSRGCSLEDLALPPPPAALPAVALRLEHAGHHLPPAALHGAGAGDARVSQHADRPRSHTFWVDGHPLADARRIRGAVSLIL